MALRQVATIAGWCFFWIWCAATGVAGAYTLSNGRRILLERGLQIQSNVYEWGMSDVPLWSSANFTAMNFYAPPNAPWEQAMLSQLPPGRLFGKKYDLDYSPSKNLTGTEVPYANRFVSMQYGDELPDITEQGRLDDMKATYAKWRGLYPNALVFTSSYGWGPHYDPVALRSYMQYTQPDMLMFDFYPEYPDMMYHVERRTAWYQVMQEYRTVALEGYDGSGTQPIAYGQFLHLWRTDASSPYPCESYVRLQQFASWAFGDTFTQAYVYNDTGSSSGGVAAMFSSRGDTSPNDVFGYVVESNRQSRNLGSMLARMVSSDIRMRPGRNGSTYNPLPAGIAAWSNGTADTGGYADYLYSIQPTVSQGGANDLTYNDVLVGYFTPLLANNSGCTFADGLHFMIVNGAWEGTASEAAQWYRITFDFANSDFDSLVRLSRDTGKAELVTLMHTSGSHYYYFDLNLPGGTGDLFAFWDSDNPLPTIPEPSALVLLTTGLIALLAYDWRRRKRFVIGVSDLGFRI
jgi:hypothetical protein